MKKLLSLLILVSILCMGAALPVSAQEPVTITFYSWEASLKDQNDAVVAAFEAKFPNIKVEVVYPVENDNTEYTKRIDMLLLAQEPIDCMIESSVAKMVGKVDRGLYQPLDSFLDAEGIVYDEVYSVDSSIGGNHYALPIDVTPWFVMINKDMLDAAGLPVPPLDWTWDDYREYARKMTQGEGMDKIYGSYFHTWNNYYQMAMYALKMDNCLYNEDGTLAFENPGFKDWLQFRYDMENVDESSVTLIDVKTAQLAYRNEYFGGKAAMLPTGAWMLAEIKDSANWPHDFQTVFAALPNWKDGGVAGRTFSDTKMLSIPVDAKHPQEAYEFIRFYTSEGAYIRAGGLVALKEADVEANIATIIGENPEAMYNLESLYAVFNNPAFTNNAPLTIPVYDAEITTMFMEECDTFMVGGTTVDECIANMMSRGADIIQRAQ